MGSGGQETGHGFGKNLQFQPLPQSAATPRDARRELKKLLGLQSLSGNVYSITELSERRGGHRRHAAENSQPKG
ncbi:MAG: hypothetical protein NTW21_15605, partial [Verrucomicrobia bacterium]|nr:hypothetical protein [Verrucomicrobiota bacterium]